MPLTQPQATSGNLVNSLKDFIATNIVAPYNTKVTGTNYPNVLSVQIGFPDDPDLALRLPLIAIEYPPRDLGQITGTGAGDGLVWRNKEFFLCCYPAVTTDGKPSVIAADTLLSYVDYAIGTAATIPIKDYSTNPATVTDYAFVVDPRIIQVRAKTVNVLAAERHRFDYRVTLRYAQTTVNG